MDGSTGRRKSICWWRFQCKSVRYDGWDDAYDIYANTDATNATDDAYATNDATYDVYATNDANDANAAAIYSRTAR